MRLTGKDGERQWDMNYQVECETPLVEYPCIYPRCFNQNGMVGCMWFLGVSFNVDGTSDDQDE